MAPLLAFYNADAKAAGVNFWEAVSAGVGKDNVYNTLLTHLNGLSPI